MSPSGLASCRSSAVNAAMSSGASERTVSPSDCHLLEDAGFHEPVDRLARRLERPPDQVRCRAGPSAGARQAMRERADPPPTRGGRTQAARARSPGVH